MMCFLQGLVPRSAAAAAIAFVLFGGAPGAPLALGPLALKNSAFSDKMSPSLCT